MRKIISKFSVLTINCILWYFCIKAKLIINDNSLFAQNFQYTVCCTKPNFKRFSRIHTHRTVAESEEFWQPTAVSQTWQTEWKTTPLAKVQLCEYEYQTLEAFVVASICTPISLIVQWPVPEFFTFIATVLRIISLIINLEIL